MQCLDPLGLRHAEQVIVAFQVTGPVGEPGAAELLFTELAALNHGAHAAIKNQNAFLELGSQLRARVL